MTASQTAAFFYLFAGADVASDLDQLLKKKGYSVENSVFINISMGQGQEPISEEALDRCIKKGGWVLFHNIHLMSMWVKQFEHNLEGSPRFPGPNPFGGQ